MGQGYPAVWWCWGAGRGKLSIVIHWSWWQSDGRGHLWMLLLPLPASQQQLAQSNMSPQASCSMCAPSFSLCGHSTSSRCRLVNILAGSTPGNVKSQTRHWPSFQGTVLTPSGYSEINVSINMEKTGKITAEKKNKQTYQQLACHHANTQWYHYYQLHSSSPYHLHLSITTHNSITQWPVCWW